MEILEIIYNYRILFAFIFLVCFLWLFQYRFIPYYRNTLREKIRKWIVTSYLDSSGKKIQIRKSLESNDFLQYLEMVDSTLMRYTGGLPSRLRLL